MESQSSVPVKVYFILVCIPVNHDFISTVFKFKDQASIRVTVLF